MIANTAFRLEPDVSPTELVDRADDFFGALGGATRCRCATTARTRTCEPPAWRRDSSSSGPRHPTWCVRPACPNGRRPQALCCARSMTSTGVRQFAEVNSAAYATYGMPAEVHPDLFDNPEAVLADPAAHIVLASKGGEPVATALVYESDGAATVQWVGTLPGARTRDSAHWSRSGSRTWPSAGALRPCRSRPLRWVRRSTSNWATRRSINTSSTSACPGDLSERRTA